MKLQQAKLLDLADVPTLGQFGEMSLELKIEWVESNPAAAAALNIAVIAAEKVMRFDGVEKVRPARLEWRGLSKTVWAKGMGLTNKEAASLAFCLSDLSAPPALAAAKELEAKKEAGESVNLVPSARTQAARQWLKYSHLPLNRLKFLVVNKARAGLAAYYSPKAIFARQARAEHNRQMREDPAYAFYVSQSLSRGELDALRAEGITTE